MTTPLQKQIKAIESVVVKVLNMQNHTDHYHTQIPSSEIITLAVYACLENQGNYSKTLKQFKQNKIFNRILEKSRFYRRLSLLADFIPEIVSLLGKTARQKLQENILLKLEANTFIIDTKPIPICQNIRIYRCRLTNNSWGNVDKDYRGYTASKRQYYYGFKLNLLTDYSGVPIEYSIHPASTGDLPALYHLHLNLPKESEILADKAYNSEDVEEYLKTQGIRLLPIVKNNSKRGKDFTTQTRISVIRKKIETALGMYSDLVPRLRVTSLIGAVIKAHLSVLAFSFYQCFRLGVLSY